MKIRAYFALLIALLLARSPSYGALGANTVWEVQTGGSDTANGAAFDPGQTAGMFTDGAATVATGNAPVFTSASYNFVAGDVGAWVYVASGTNWTPGWYKISSVAANAATLNGTIGAAVTANSGSPSPSTVAGCATTASPTAATWSIDYSQQSSPQITYTDLASVGSGLLVSSVAHPFGKQQVGNGLVITAGTNFNAGIYVIASVSVGLVATVVGPTNITSAAGVSGVGSLGGAAASPGFVAGLKVAGNDVFIQSGTYTIASTTANIATGRINDTVGGVDPTNTAKWIGYQTVRGDRGTKPILQVASSGFTSATVMILAAAQTQVDNLKIDGQSKASITGLSLTTNYTRALRIQVINTTVLGISLADSQGTVFVFQSTVSGSSGTAAFFIGNSDAADGCEAFNNTTSGFQLGGFAQCSFCLSYANSGASSDGFTLTSVGYRVFDSVAYGNGRAGFDLTGNAGFGTLLQNTIAEGNGSVGYRTTAVVQGVFLINAAGFNNTGGNFTATQIPPSNIQGFVAGSSSFFVNPGSGNFALNNTIGGGAAARAAGFPGVYPSGTTTGFIDIGGAQHQGGGQISGAYAQ